MYVSKSKETVADSFSQENAQKRWRKHKVSKVREEN